MRFNIGPIERIIRIFVGLFIAGIGLGTFYVGEPLGELSKIVLDITGGEIFLTGVLGWSPLYELFKFSTSDTEGMI